MKIYYIYLYYKNVSKKLLNQDYGSYKCSNNHFIPAENTKKPKGTQWEHLLEMDQNLFVHLYIVYFRINVKWIMKVKYIKLVKVKQTLPLRIIKGSRYISLIVILYLLNIHTFVAWLVFFEGFE